MSQEAVLTGFRDYLDRLGKSQEVQRFYLASARSLLRFQPERELSERIEAWLAAVARQTGLGFARDRVGAVRCFLRFLGIERLERVVTQVRSCQALLRALGRVPWADAMEEVRRPAPSPRFASALGGRLQALLDYREGRQMKSGDFPRTLRRLDRVAIRHGVTRFDQVTPAMLEEICSEGRPGPSTRNKRVSHLRVLQRFLEAREESLFLPDGLSVREPTFRPHLFTLQELGSILAWLSERRPRTDPFRWLGVKTVVFLLYACGMRLSEPLSLRVQDVDLERATLFLRRTKFYKQRWVPLGSGAMRQVARYARARAERFPSARGGQFFLDPRGRPLGAYAVRTAFRQAIEHLGIASRGTRAPRLHDLRHTLAVHRLYQWYAEGVNVQNKLPLLTAYLGHDRIHSTETYLHLTQDLIRQAGRQFERSFEQVVGRWVPG